MFAPGAEREAFKIAVGEKPNGLAFDPARGILLAANVGDPSITDSHTVSVVDRCGNAAEEPYHDVLSAAARL